MAESTNSGKVSILNRQLNYKYTVIEKIECGVELKGSEVKSIRQAKCNLKDSFAFLKNSEVILKNMYIAPYDMANINNVSSTRDRRLLLNRYEILKITNMLNQGGYTLVPAKLYSKGRWIKLELAICKGKKLYDKRESIKQKEANKQINVFKKIVNNKY